MSDEQGKTDAVLRPMREEGSDAKVESHESENDEAHDSQEHQDDAYE